MVSRRLFVTVAAGLALVGAWAVATPEPQVAMAQGAPAVRDLPTVIGPVSYAVSEPAFKLTQEEAPPIDDAKPKVVAKGEMTQRQVLAENAKMSVDPVVQTNPPPAAMPPPILTFEGLSSADNFAAFGFRVLPPDTNGDVGPNHYVEQTNLLVRVYSKAGAPLTPPFKLSTLFAPLGGECATPDSGDPVVLYDPLADRWLLSQFAFAAVNAPPYHQCIAISKTADPTGAYYLYDFVTPGNNFPDYPKLGVWPDAYYMTTNQFLLGGSFNGAGAFAFERSRMLAGDPAARLVYFNLDLASHPEAIGGMLPSDIDGGGTSVPGLANTFIYFLADEFGDASDALRLFDFRVNWAWPNESTFTERPESPLAVAAFNPLTPAGRDDIEQPPPANNATMALDSISDRLMHRLSYRALPFEDSLVVTHTVNVGTGTTIATHQAGVRYYELRCSGQGWRVHEQGTFAPDTDNRWMGSAAIDHEGNLAVGYSVSSTTTFPSIRYAGRLADDPPGSLTQGEASLIAGSGVQTSTTSRWGDYSSMSVDPVDECTFWYAQEYYTLASQGTSTAGWLTRIGAFKFPGCTPHPKGTIQGSVTNAVTGTPIANALVQAGDFSRHTSSAGAYSMSVAPGAYHMTASKFGYRSASANVNVGNGATVTRNFALHPVPVIETAGSALVTEGCAPPTNAIDPDERVTVSFSLRNVGVADTANLIATLVSGTGVDPVTSSQNYGVLAAGGASASRNFTFFAYGECGSTITATLHLRDGSTNLGSVSFDFTTGALGAPVTANYSSGNIAVPIPDVSTAEVPLNVTDSGVISDVNVRVRLNHTFDGDLDLILIHPDGTEVPLSANRGGAGANFGSGANDCSGTFTVFDDGAATAISAGTAPFAGSFRPESPLAGLNGKPTNGTWRLRVRDEAAIDVGTIGCVQFQVTRRQRLCCPFEHGIPDIVAVPPANLTAESCGGGNGAPDPGETVSVGFPLQNVGTGLPGNVVATLQASGGVTNPGGPQSYGALSPVGPPVSRSFNFTVGSGVACGSNLTATLQLQDGSTDLGDVTFTMRVGATVAATATLANPAPILIPDSGPAAPYPSTILVSGLTNPVTKVTATLRGLTHTFPSDIDVLLVGPGGQTVVLMSDAGGGTDVSAINLTFDDAAAAELPATLVTGTFRPTNVGTGDTFPAPAPPPPHGAVLSAFNGVNPNGTWSLFVVDDAGGDVGTFAQGWQLHITTAAPVCCTSLSRVSDLLFSPEAAAACVAPGHAEQREIVLTSTF
jgi:subtilisin-like proprotein convertase family protein